MQLADCQKLLASLHGASFAGLDTVTIPVLKGGKSNPMQGRIEKRCTGHRVMLFTNSKTNAYENKVRRHLLKEGKNPDSFVLGPLPWGERLPDSPIIHNKGKYYIQVVFLKPGQTEYFLDGEPIEKESIQGLNEKTGSEHQGLEEQVIVRTYALESIIALRAFKEELN